jgi:hypothetical protein
MKYAMVIVKADEEWEALSEANGDFDSLVSWWAGLRASGKITAGAQLAPPSKAITVSWRGQDPIVTDGPYLEAKETVGGFGILDVDSAEEALGIASSWPAKVGIRIELRPVVTGG